MVLTIWSPVATSDTAKCCYHQWLQILAQKMKITHIVEASATGTLSMLAVLANAQAAQRNEVEVIYSIRPETPKNLESLFSPDIVLSNIQMSNVRDKISSVNKIRSRLKETSPSNVIMHSSFAGFLGRVASISILPRTNFFYIPHCISFMRKDISTIKRFLFILFEWCAALKKTDYIACSESEKNEISKYIPFRHCHLVENAVSTDKSTLPSSNTHLKTIITVGQIRPQKGPEEFSAIAKASLLIDPTISFIWIGDGDEHYKKQLIESGVTVLGWMQKEDVMKNLSKADIYLSSAKWEGMPVSLIEAIFAGLPIIASRCAGNIDVVSHGQTGFIYDTADEATQLISELISNPHKATTLAQNAFNIAKERFSVSRYINDINNLMNKPQ